MSRMRNKRPLFQAMLQVSNRINNSPTLLRLWDILLVTWVIICLLVMCLVISAVIATLHSAFIGDFQVFQLVLSSVFKGASTFTLVGYVIFLLIEYIKVIRNDRIEK